MTSLRQASFNLAQAFQVSPRRLERVRHEMNQAGLLPVARGTIHPTAQPSHIALLILALTTNDPARIRTLAQLPAYTEVPGDFGINITLQQVLAMMVEDPKHSTAAMLTVSTNGAPYAWLSRSDCSGPTVCFGEADYLSHHVSQQVMLHLPMVEVFRNVQARAVQEAA